MNNDKKIPNVPNLRFPEFQGEWEWHKLGDLADISKGSGISKDQLSEQGQPCILYGELYTKYKSEVIQKIISRTDIDNRNLVKSQVNDVIIPSSGETAIDIATARYVPFSDILLGGDINIIRLNKDNGGFLSYQLNGIRKRDIAKVAQGVSVIHLYGESLKKLDVTICSREEQNKIARFLYLLDERIDTQNKIIKELETLIKGITHLLVEKKETNAMLKDCLTCHSSTLMENAVAGGSGMYPVYGAAGIIANTPDYEIDGDGILIIKDGASVGKVQYATGKYSVIGTLNYLKPKGKASLKYFYYYLQAFNFDRYRVGSGIPHIYFKDYGSEPVYCPPIEEQTYIADFLSAIDEKLDAERQILKGYTTQKKYLLTNMFI